MQKQQQQNIIHTVANFGKFANIICFYFPFCLQVLFTWFLFIPSRQLHIYIPAQQETLVGAVLRVGFLQMLAILHDNMRNAKDTNQAVNGSLSIFHCVSFLELMMQQFGLVSSVLSIACATGALSSKQNGGILVAAQSELQ